ncbi:hypothetical protein B0H10DRAFT_2262370 [Mycena sp. CBHHK59/15]|nr:hypothetical protein B0H10DRAFT_2262370 [Mycena sp. CBHHK59/15]
MCMWPDVCGLHASRRVEVEVHTRVEVEVEVHACRGEAEAEAGGGIVVDVDVCMWTCRVVALHHGGEEASAGLADERTSASTRAGLARGLADEAPSHSRGLRARHWVCVRAGLLMRRAVLVLTPLACGRGASLSTPTELACAPDAPGGVCGGVRRTKEKAGSLPVPAPAQGWHSSSALLADLRDSASRLTTGPGDCLRTRRGSSPNEACGRVSAPRGACGRVSAPRGDCRAHRDRTQGQQNRPRPRPRRLLLLHHHYNDHDHDSCIPPGLPGEPSFDFPTPPGLTRGGGGSTSTASSYASTSSSDTPPFPVLASIGASPGAKMGMGGVGALTAGFMGISLSPL